MVALLALVLVFGFSVVTIAGTYSGGDGIEGNPYQIATTDDLIELSNTPGDWGSYFKQTSDITFSSDETQVDWDGDGSANWDAEDQKGFSPIGNDTTKFTGSYDGDDYTIENLYIDRDSTDNVGLFGYVSGGEIRNVNLTNATIHGNGFVGGLVGWHRVGASGGGKVSNSYSSGSVNGSGDNVGGLVGSNYGGSVSNSSSSGNVTGSGKYVGGLVGSNYGGSVSNSYSSGNVTGSSQVGGLVGRSTGPVSNSYSSGSVNGSGDNVGGLVGHNNDTVKFSSSTGSVNGSGDKVGGLVGINIGTVSNSYSTGSVNGSKFVGGLVGHNFNTGKASGTVKFSYSSGSVDGSGDNVGGLVGSNKSFGGFGTVGNSTWDIGTSGLNSSAVASGNSTSEMKLKSTFIDAGWTFNGNPWKISDGHSRPYLAWQEVAVDNSYPTNVSATSVEFPEGNIHNNSGGQKTVDYGYEYRKESNSSWTSDPIGSDTVNDGDDLTINTTALESLSPKTSYYARSYATDGSTVWYGDTVHFTTKEIQPPTAAFTYSPGSPDTTDEVTFDATDSEDPDGDIVSYNWDLDGGDTPTGEEVTKTYDSSGTYTVELQVVDNDGATGSTTKEITVGVNTKEGKDVKVDFTDEGCYCGKLEGMILTYDEVTDAGETTVSTHEELPFSPPEGINFLGCFYEVTTTAKYSGDILARINYDDSGLTDESEKNLRKFKLTGDETYLDLTAGRDRDNNYVKGKTSSLSYFGLGYGLGTIPEEDLINHGPNPAGSEGVIFWFDLPEGSSGGELTVYDVDGLPLLRADIDSDQIRYPEVGRWNLRDDNGNLLGNGIYLYRLRLDGAGSASSSDVGRLVIDRTN